jgi:hypothetical protein
MSLHLIVKYPQLLELNYLNSSERKLVLKEIFDRDISLNLNFKFVGKQIRPTKKEGEAPMDTLFHHLTTREEKGKDYKKRTFEMDRSVRLHWIKTHINENTKDEIKVFSYEDRVNRKDVIRTYIFNTKHNYVIILEPQRSEKDYYLLTAYYLNEPSGKKQINNKFKNKLDKVY